MSLSLDGAEDVAAVADAVDASVGADDAVAVAWEAPEVDDAVAVASLPVADAMAWLKAGIRAFDGAGNLVVGRSSGCSGGAVEVGAEVAGVEIAVGGRLMLLPFALWPD